MTKCLKCKEFSDSERPETAWMVVIIATLARDTFGKALCVVRWLRDRRHRCGIVMGKMRHLVMRCNIIEHCLHTDTARSMSWLGEGS